MSRAVKVSQQQYNTLKRYPRHKGVWSQLGVRIASSTQVLVQNGSVRVIQQPQRRKSMGVARSGR